jgi:hypothetical protein
MLTGFLIIFTTLFLGFSIQVSQEKNKDFTKETLAMDDERFKNLHKS